MASMFLHGVGKIISTSMNSLEMLGYLNGMHFYHPRHCFGLLHWCMVQVLSLIFMLNVFQQFPARAPSHTPPVPTDARIPEDLTPADSQTLQTRLWLVVALPWRNIPADGMAFQLVLQDYVW